VRHEAQEDVSVGHVEGGELVEPGPGVEEARDVVGRLGRAAAHRPDLLGALG
jgi:hypothetical protein